jgi:hypothetical protein
MSSYSTCCDHLPLCRIPGSFFCFTWIECRWIWPVARCNGTYLVWELCCLDTEVCRTTLLALSRGHALMAKLRVSEGVEEYVKSMLPSFAFRDFWLVILVSWARFWKIVWQIISPPAELAILLFRSDYRNRTVDFLRSSTNRYTHGESAAELDHQSPLSERCSPSLRWR